LKLNKSTQWNQLTDKNLMSVLQVTTTVMPNLQLLASKVQDQQSH